jgi:hypothetical protein
VHSGQPDLEVADSFLVDDGRVVALAEHRARFLADSGFAEPGWRAALAAVPASGAWFPRVEKRSGIGHPQLVLRPAPPRTATVVLATAARDPRRSPFVKGPDLDALAVVRADAQAAGAGEAVLLAPSGRVVEGTSSALAWWRAGALHVVDPALPRLRSVTEGVVRALAAESGVDVVPALATPAELEGAEVWSLSSLHGIRAATAWLDGPRLAQPDPARLAAWRARWAARSEPVQSGG